MSLLLRGASKHWRELCWKAHQAFLWQHLKMWGVSHHNTNPLWQLSHIHIDPKLLHIKPVKKNITFPCSYLHLSTLFSSFHSCPSFLSSHRPRGKIHLLILRLKSFRGLITRAENCRMSQNFSEQLWQHFWSRRSVIKLLSINYQCKQEQSLIQASVTQFSWIITDCSCPRADVTRVWGLIHYFCCKCVIYRYEDKLMGVYGCISARAFSSGVICFDQIHSNLSFPAH